MPLNPATALAAGSKGGLYAFQSSSSSLQRSFVPSSWLFRSSRSSSSHITFSPPAKLRRPAHAPDRVPDVMRCKSPYRSAAGEFGCGQCMPCRVNRRRLWTGRIVLESRHHEHNAFATFTYADPCPFELDPRHLQLFWKKLRKVHAPFRYFAVGEYGDKTFRPHYHAALFGVSFLEGELLAQTWEHGFIHLGELNHNSAQYIAGYVTKKMTAKDDPRLEGRHPEFARMSLRPGIGRLAMTEAGRHFTESAASRGLLKMGDVPRDIQTDGKSYPLGRYLRNALREEVGWEGTTPQGVRLAISYKNSLMSAEDITASENKRAAAAASAEARVKISGSKKVL